MNIKSRDESISSLSEKLSKEQLHRAITQGYSNISLSVISHFKGEYAAMFFDSKYSANTINKLINAYSDDKIDTRDLIRTVKYTAHNNKNEPYVDDFLDSIDNGFYHENAARTFSAVLYENCSYNEAAELVKSGAFYSTEYASLSVTNEVAEQLDEIGVPLRACEGFNYNYDVEDLNEALERDAAIFVQDKFKEYIEVEMCGRKSELSGGKLSELREGYIRKNRDVQLYNKVQGEYDEFISNMKKQPAEIIIESAYEIVSKENIVMYCEEYPLNMTDKEFAALLSSKNTLDEVYRQWCDNGEWQGLEDIGLALEETADRIQIAIDREIAEKKSAEIPENISAEKQAVKPKNKAR